METHLTSANMPLASSVQRENSTQSVGQPIIKYYKDLSWVFLKISAKCLSCYYTCKNIIFLHKHKIAEDGKAGLL